MSETTFRLARLGEDAAIIDFINDNFDMRLPLLNRPELYHHYYAGRGGVPQFAVAEEDGRYVSAAGYILANTRRKPDIWVSVWVAAKGHNGVGLELMNALPGLLNADVVACNNIRPAPSTSSSAGGPNGFPTTTVWAAAALTTLPSRCGIPCPRSSAIWALPRWRTPPT